MSHPIDRCRGYDDEKLLAQARALARHEREFLYELIARLSVIDERQAFKPRYGSMFEYCCAELGFSEAVTYGRIRVARLASRVPAVLDYIRDGVLPLSHLEKVAAHVTVENAAEIAARIRSLPTREVERFAASLAPAPDLGDSARAQSASPARGETVTVYDAVAPAAPGPERDKLRWLSASRVLFRFTGGAALHEKILRAAAVLRRSGLRVRFEDVLAAALDCFLRAAGGVSWPAERRRIPRWVRRVVWRRDAGRCTWTRDGVRCEEREGLEYDHIRPWKDGGSSEDPDNLRLLCPPHHIERHR